ncbi:hypothetical protein KEJ47_08955, partial [Candidatus Bathyarchaeota archaeon]|nr:hypothetical protein [Candidatus Bathyarchaeota archaeon]
WFAYPSSERWKSTRFFFREKDLRKASYYLVKWSTECPSTSSYDCRSDSCSSNDVISSYALVKKVSGTGTYSVSANVENCVNANCKMCGSPTFNDIWSWNYCWRKMKDSNCNNLDWYDFHGDLGTAFPKCGVGTSQAQHYDDFVSYYGFDVWCPEPEVMWKNIKCGGEWPSGNDGDTCKVWFLCFPNICYREGVWDPDDGYCIITSGDPPTGGCNANRTESRADGVVDLCG